MKSAAEELARPVLIGRSSSHFTRVTRIFAAEMRVDHSFQIVRDLMSRDPGEYGGNPALKLPALRTSRGVWFGALNICRELYRQSSHRPRTIWPEDLDEPLLANAQELVAQAMATEVTLILSRLSGTAEDNAHYVKMRASLVNTMSWLEDNVARVVGALPADRELSYMEVSLFCLATHLEFRDVLPLSLHPNLSIFCQRFGTRASAAETAFRFDT